MHSSKSSIFEPPGGILIWLLVIVELVSFGIGIAFFAISQRHSPMEFAEGRARLSALSGLIYTLLLLVSGWLLAEFVRAYFARQKIRSLIGLTAAMLLGSAFLVFKILDFREKVRHGLTLGKNDFWDFYWLLSGFHFLHVLTGLTILTVVLFFILRDAKFADEDFAVRGSATFWHMCDLIWLMIFPLFYLAP